MNIAIVGSGISGLVTAYLLRQDHLVTIFEANDYIGGHTHTVEVPDGDRVHAVDTGFIVYNEGNYPNFTRLLDRLDVPTQASDMSFGVACERTGLEYSGASLQGMIAQRRNLLRPAFYRMVADILRFHRRARTLDLDGEADATLGEFLARHRYGNDFIERFLVPMAAAIWSSRPARIRDFPLRHFIRFFRNHGLLQLVDRPTWRVIQGGSWNYVERLTSGWVDRIRTRCPVTRITRRPEHVDIETATGTSERFDQVVIAAHADQALRLLSDPSPQEKSVLSSFGYQTNRVALHTDASVMPSRKRAWASWNYRIPRAEVQQPTVTYHMNRLQSLHSPVDYCVSLNQDSRIADGHRLGTFDYAHPVFDASAYAAQGRFGEINGVRRTHYCGAYWGDGFHEDGVNSALAVCQWFGASL